MYLNRNNLRLYRPNNHQMTNFFNSFSLLAFHFLLFLFLFNYCFVFEFYADKAFYELLLSNLKNIFDLNHGQPPP